MRGKVCEDVMEGLELVCCFMDQRARVERRKEKGVGSFIGKDEN